MIAYINKNGGFTVVGQYKKGSAKGVSYTKDEGKEDKIETKIHYHIVYLVPTNCKQDNIQEIVKFDPSILEKDEEEDEESYYRSHSG